MPGFRGWAACFVCACFICNARSATVVRKNAKWSQPDYSFYHDQCVPHIMGVSLMLLKTARQQTSCYGVSSQLCRAHCTALLHAQIRKRHGTSMQIFLLQRPIPLLASGNLWQPAHSAQTNLDNCLCTVISCYGQGLARVGHDMLNMQQLIVSRISAESRSWLRSIKWFSQVQKQWRYAPQAVASIPSS